MFGEIKVCVCVCPCRRKGQRSLVIPVDKRVHRGAVVAREQMQLSVQARLRRVSQMLTLLRSEIVVLCVFVNHC